MYEILIITDHNNLHHFIDIKSLYSRQVHWNHKQFQYYFQINYYQGKVNRVTDALSKYPKHNAKDEVTFLAKNIKALHYL